MSQENVKVVRAAFEAFDERDFRTAADAFDRDVEWDSTVLIDEEVIHGRAAMLEYWERISRTFPSSTTSCGSSTRGTRSASSPTFTLRVREVASSLCSPSATP